MRYTANMKKSQQFTTFLVLTLTLSTIILTGASCNNAKTSATKTTNTNSSTISETDYYNLIIDNVNQLSDQADVIRQQYQGWQQATTSADRAKFTMGSNPYQGYNAMKADLVDTKVVSANAAAQAVVEQDLAPYVTEYKTMLDAAVALSDYYSKEQYKDDKEAQKDTLSKALSKELDSVGTDQKKLLTTVTQYQDQVSLNIDEATQDPLQVITLSQTKITADVEKLYNDYATWIQAEDKSTNANADATAMKNDYTQLNTDLQTYQTKANTLGVSNLQKAGPAFKNYTSSVQALADQFKTVFDNITNNNVGDLAQLDSSVLKLYNAVVDAHNSLVDAVKGEASQ